MNILAIDKHTSRHDNLNSLLHTQFPKASIIIIGKLEGHATKLDQYSLILIHVGNSADYTIIYKSNPIKNIIYYTGQFEVLEQDEEGIWAPYDELQAALNLVSFS